MQSCFDLSSDHSPILTTLNLAELNQAPHPRLSNKQTNWDYFLQLISAHLNTKVLLKTIAQTDDAAKYFNDMVHWACWNATPEHTHTSLPYDCPPIIKQKLAEKRRLRKAWHNLRTPASKTLFNKVTQELKQLLYQHKNARITTFLQELTPTASTDYSLWKTTRKIKQATQFSTPIRTPQETWARSDAKKHMYSPTTSPQSSNPTRWTTTHHHTTPSPRYWNHHSN
jgi:hypothetical protein